VLDATRHGRVGAWQPGAARCSYGAAPADAIDELRAASERRLRALQEWACVVYA
jgi:hypothetical protein